MSENNYADFWKNLPGPGHWRLGDFELIPKGLDIWEGVRVAAEKRLGDAWTLEQVDDGTVVLRRKERPLVIRLRRFINQPDIPYEIAAALLVPDEKALAYSVGAEFFREAFEERLGWRIGTYSTIDPSRRDRFGDPQLTDCKLFFNLRHARRPGPSEIQIFSCWLVWAVLALEWAVETIEANPNP